MRERERDFSKNNKAIRLNNFISAIYSEVSTPTPVYLLVTHLFGRTFKRAVGKE